MANFWIKDQNGDPSVIVTLVAVSFVAVTVGYILSLFDRVGNVAVRPFDVAACGAYFGAIMAAFVGHHWVTTKYVNGHVVTDDSSATTTTTKSVNGQVVAEVSATDATSTTTTMPVVPGTNPGVTT